MIESWKRKGKLKRWEGSYEEVTGERKEKTAGIFPNAIEIISGSRKNFFGSFLSRDDTFKVINDGWLRQVNDARLVLEQQEPTSELSSQENEFVTVDNVKSSDILDNEALSTDLSQGTSMCKDEGVPSIVGEDPTLMVVPEKQSSVEQIAESELNNNPRRLSSKWNEEDIDAPTNFKCASWHPCCFGYARELSFQHPIKVYLGAKLGGCNEVQKYRVYRNSHLVIQTSQEVSDVPYADYFHVEGLWNVERNKDESKECCILRVYVNVVFCKKTIWRGKIVQSTVDECKEAYGTWINMAHEFLKQKNLVKEESVAAVVQNGKTIFDREAKTGETSEESQVQSNPKGRETTSYAIDDSIRNVSTQLQGNFIGTSSIPSLFREFATKIRSSLKNQSNLSLLLVTIFALIFFMQQFSILMLLARPQHIHMNPPVEFMNKMDNGVTRNPSDIAWLEKRVYYLKDEIYMVETRLERMRYEHALIKKQLKDLEHI
ncbi:hypothetical protein TSUD_352710 [Trifolium subterraneum]|nr:hypothetical protein TSUD_352710 [Trifolium subterraneum]